MVNSVLVSRDLIYVAGLLQLQGRNVYQALMAGWSLENVAGKGHIANGTRRSSVKVSLLSHFQHTTHSSPLNKLITLRYL